MRRAEGKRGTGEQARRSSRADYLAVAFSGTADFGTVLRRRSPPFSTVKISHGGSIGTVLGSPRLLPPAAGRSGAAGHWLYFITDRPRPVVLRQPQDLRERKEHPRKERARVSPKSFLQSVLHGRDVTRVIDQYKGILLQVSLRKLRRQSKDSTAFRLTE